MEQAEQKGARARLHIVPCSVRDASSFVAKAHRHHRPPAGGLFAVAVADDAGTCRGVAIVGRPVARKADTGWTCEVTRVATDGCPNACSALYGAAWRAARALGWRRMVTYTLPSEGGASLRGAGWRDCGPAGGGDGWMHHPRPSLVAENQEVKTRWEVGESAAPFAKHPTRPEQQEDEQRQGRLW